MATITGSINPASITSTHGSNVKGKISVSFTSVSQDDEANTSTINFSAKGDGEGAGYWLYGWGFYYSYDNSTWTKIKEFTTQSDSSAIRPSTYEKSGWQTGSFTINHNDDGERVFYFKIKHLFRYGANSARWNAEDGTGYNAKATKFTETLSTIPLQTIRIRINGVWKKAFPYVRVNGVWKKAKAHVRVNNTWKKGG